MSKKSPKSANKSEEKSPLQKYLSQNLPPFRRGDGDCVAFVAGWVNLLKGEELITLKPLTFGDVARALRAKSLASQVADNLQPLGFSRAKEPSAGDVVVYRLEEAFGGIAVGILSDSGAVTRMEGESLHLTKEPDFVDVWTLS